MPRLVSLWGSIHILRSASLTVMRVDPRALNGIRMTSQIGAVFYSSLRLTDVTLPGQ